MSAQRDSLLASSKMNLKYFMSAVLIAVLGAGAGNSALDGDPEATTPVSIPASNRPSQGEEEGKPVKRLREGTFVTDQFGFFREDGEGATFVADSGMEFGALPNLNLERVLRLLKSAEEPTSIRWSVSGEVTEFNSRNFLLISRAVYKSAAPPPAPERVDQ